MHHSKVRKSGFITWKSILKQGDGKMIDWESWISKKGFSWAMTLAIVSGVIGVVVFIVAIIFWFNDGLINNGAVDPNASGSFGSFIGGVVGVFIGLFTAGVTVAVLSYQIKELKATVKAQETSASALEAQLKTIEFQNDSRIIYDELNNAQSAIESIVQKISSREHGPVRIGRDALRFYLDKIENDFSGPSFDDLNISELSTKISLALLPYDMIWSIMTKSNGSLDPAFKIVICKRITSIISTNMIMQLTNIKQLYEKFADDVNSSNKLNDITGALKLFEVYSQFNQYESDCNTYLSEN